ncbi:hypothetical protein DCO58_00580 [Helicobacter saguini]|uniref:Uncharacterized protein n=1 Tax=Helicobacter saguini TaxID=1548018 RepID=A0A347VQY1_9HELI|nr:hypothetical protein [Helicobacter saguini]MWV63114.1 hypothetical protein [Helicobacter saguini]MWV66216.1 hypothetical protein [Helicobacter saguini]MWV71880.1 hypothetical protein [Helicobacter saguini]TLD95895.1 hypothetical protein LS64_000575 [Helicobacter saguini]
MKKFCLFVIFLAFIGLNQTQAKEPFSPDFTLNVIQGMEPPPLPQVYGIDVPDIWGQYEEKNLVATSPLLPETPMIMEVCAITGRPQYAYANSQELLAGCYRGDAGLSLLELQPYEYWESLSSVGRERLMPRGFEAPFNVRVVINYRNARVSNAPFKTIELGEFDSPTSYIAINGQVFQHNLEIMRAIYGVIYDIYDERI